MADSRESMRFEEAKGVVQGAASAAKKSLGAYFIQYGKNELPSLTALCNTLGAVANKAAIAESPDGWMKSMTGNINGSTYIGAIVAAHVFIPRIIHFDKELPDGSEDDAPGTLTKVGLQKLDNSLAKALAAIRQYSESAQRLKPNYNLFAPNRAGRQNILTTLQNTVFPFWSNQAGNEGLMRNHIRNYDPRQDGRTL